MILRYLTPFYILPEASVASEPMKQKILFTISFPMLTKKSIFDTQALFLSYTTVDSSCQRGAKKRDL